MQKKEIIFMEKTWKLVVTIVGAVGLAIVGGVLLLQYGFGIQVFQASAYGGTQVIRVDETGRQVETASFVCTGGQTQSLDINAHSVDSPTTALTEAHNIYRECGSYGSLGTYTQGTAITALQTGSCYEFLFGVDATAGNRYDNAYGPVIKIPKLPCVMTSNIPLFPDEVEGSITGTFYNSNHDASAETLVASTPVIVYVKLYGADKEYYGNPYIGEAGYMGLDWAKIKQLGFTYVKGLQNGNHRPEYPNTVCIQLNTTYHNEPKWVKAKLQDGSVVEMRRVSAPTIHSVSAGHKDYCYEGPILSGTAIELQIKVDPKSTASTDDDVLKYYASSWWADTDTGVVNWGAEDNDGNAIGASDPISVTLDWTA